MISTPLTIKHGKARLETGFQMHYAEHGDPQGQPVIFLHGFTDSWFSFSGVMTSLPVTFHAFALDQRGHGISERPEHYDMDAFAADVEAFMSTKGLKDVTLVGHSMGSFVAQRVALNHPERLVRLVLIGSMTTPLNEVTQELDEIFRAVRDPISPEFVREFQESTIYHPVPDEFLDAVIAESLKLPARVWRDAWAGFFEAKHAERLRDIDVPTFIFWGEQDGAFPREDQVRLRDLIPKASLTTYAETGHALHWERPARFAEDFIEFAH